MLYFRASQAVSSLLNRQTFLGNSDSPVLQGFHECQKKSLFQLVGLIINSIPSNYSKMSTRQAISTTTVDHLSACTNKADSYCVGYSSSKQAIQSAISNHRTDY